MASFTNEHVQKINAISSGVTSLQSTITAGGTASDYTTWLKLEDVKRQIISLQSVLNPTVR